MKYVRMPTWEDSGPGERDQAQAAPPAVPDDVQRQQRVGAAMLDRDDQPLRGVRYCSRLICSPVASWSDCDGAGASEIAPLGAVGQP